MGVAQLQRLGGDEVLAVVEPLAARLDPRPLRPLRLVQAHQEVQAGEQQQLVARRPGRPALARSIACSARSETARSVSPSQTAASRRPTRRTRCRRPARCRGRRTGSRGAATAPRCRGRWPAPGPARRRRRRRSGRRWSRPRPTGGWPATTAPPGSGSCWPRGCRSRRRTSRCRSPCPRRRCRRAGCARAPPARSPSPGACSGWLAAGLPRSAVSAVGGEQAVLHLLVDEQHLRAAAPVAPHVLPVQPPPVVQRTHRRLGVRDHGVARCAPPPPRAPRPARCPRRRRRTPCPPPAAPRRRCPCTSSAAGPGSRRAGPRRAPPPGPGHRTGWRRCSCRRV